MCQMGRLLGLSRCQDNGFCLAQRRGLSQEDEPKRLLDMKRHIDDRRAIASGRYTHGRQTTLPTPQPPAEFAPTLKEERFL